MSNEWIPVAYALIAAISAGFSAWVGAKYALKETDKKVDLVSAQNNQQSIKLDSVHKELNSRLEEWREDVRNYIAAEIKAALATGRATGVEQERMRGEEKK